MLFEKSTLPLPSCSPHPPAKTFNWERRDGPLCAAAVFPFVISAAFSFLRPAGSCRRPFCLPSASVAVDPKSLHRRGRGTAADDQGTVLAHCRGLPVRLIRRFSFLWPASQQTGFDAAPAHGCRAERISESRRHRLNGRAQGTVLRALSQPSHSSYSPRHSRSAACCGSFYRPNRRKSTHF